MHSVGIFNDWKYRILQNMLVARWLRIRKSHISNPNTTNPSLAKLRKPFRSAIRAVGSFLYINQTNLSHRNSGKYLNSRTYTTLKKSLPKLAGKRLGYVEICDMFLETKSSYRAALGLTLNAYKFNRIKSLLAQAYAYHIEMLHHTLRARGRRTKF